jgi:molybdopterin/thiamine biosynthesis adenylyltransferase
MPFGEQLATARVHIGGMGRIGTGVAIALQEAGVGEISCNDPQTFQEEQLQVSAFSRRSDVGRPKVHVLERFFDGRSNFIFTPLVTPNHSRTLKPFLEQADVIVSCANQLHARMHLERMATRLGKPSVQACAQDGRLALGGLISVWIPDRNCSCFGCLFPDPNMKFPRGEILLPTVTRVIGSFAAHLIVKMLGGRTGQAREQHNVFALDLVTQRTEPMSIRPRSGFRICGASRLVER